MNRFLRYVNANPKDKLNSSFLEQIYRCNICGVKYRLEDKSNLSCKTPECKGKLEKITLLSQSCMS